MSLPAEPLPEARQVPANPFPGLRPFEIEESDLFFGRQDNVRELLDRLRRSRFLSVVGASGCGKSSLIKAGLLAALRDGFLVESGAAWRMAILRPGDNPIGRLAAALHEPGALGDLYPAAEDRAGLEATLRRGSLGLVEAVEEAPLPPQSRLFILVDQFEELFRFGHKGMQEEARAFVKLLTEAAAQRRWRLYVALTLRSDFLGHCAGFPTLPDAINQGLYLVPQMSRAQLRDAVRGPVARDGGQITERLVNRLLNDLGEEPDQLPVLQHALMRIWSHWSEARRGPLDLEHYERIGGIAEALARHLEEVFGKLDPGGARIAERLFRCLTETTDERQVVRRPTRLGRIAKAAGAGVEEVGAVIDRFRAPDRSFLMPPWDVELTADSVIDISHESLIRQWPRLSGWAAAEAKDSRVAREITQGAEIWRDRQRESSYLFHGARLAEAEEWSKAYPGELGELEQEFVREGAKLREQQVLARHETELPQKVAEQAAARGRAIEKKAAYIYVSSCAQDREFARDLQRALRQAGFESTGALGEEAAVAPVLAHVQASIDSADAVVCVLSPDYADASLCRAEIECALKSNKRLVPILHRTLDPALAHPALAPLHWIDLRGLPLVDDALAPVLAAVGADLDWVRMHTRLLLRAADWKTRGRDKSLLLRGSDLEEAEAWLATNGPHRQPPATDDQVTFLLASRQATTELGRLVRGVLTLALIAMLVLATTSFFKWREATEQRRETEVSMRRAQASEREAEAAMRRAQASEAELRASWGQIAPVVPVDPPTSLPPPDDPPVDGKDEKTDLAQSYAANEQLQAVVQEAVDPQALQRRGQIQVRYYKDLSQQLETSKLEYDLRGLGFSVEPRNRVGRTATNALWFGRRVPMEDVQAIAYLLVRAGVSLQYVGCYLSSNGRELTVQIGGRPQSAQDPALPVDDISQGAGLTMCEPDAATDLPPPPEGPETPAATP